MKSKMTDSGSALERVHTSILDDNELKSLDELIEYTEKRIKEGFDGNCVDVNPRDLLRDAGPQWRKEAIISHWKIEYSKIGWEINYQSGSYYFRVNPAYKRDKKLEKILE